MLWFIHWNFPLIYMTPHSINGVMAKTLSPKQLLREWEKDSEVKSISCSYRGPWFNFLYPHGSSQPFVPTV